MKGIIRFLAAIALSLIPNTIFTALVYSFGAVHLSYLARFLIAAGSFHLAWKLLDMRTRKGRGG